MRYGKLGVLAAGAATLVASVGLLVGGSGAAIAAGGGGPTPPWESSISPAPNGAITFYNAQGQVVTGGSITASGLAAYAVATTPDPRSGDDKATIYAYTPVSGENPAFWSGEQLSSSTNYPNTSAPAPVGTTTNPVHSNTAGTDTSLAQFIQAFPNTQTASGYVGLYDIRMRASGTGIGVESQYWDAVISVHITAGTPTDPTAGTWSVDFPDFTQNTTTTLTANPPTESTSGPITLTATVSPTADSGGTVSFWNGTTQVGTTQTVSGTGTASVSATPLNGTTKYTAIFTPKVGSADIGSTGSLSYLVGTGPAATTTTLTANPATSAQQGSSVTLTGTVSPASAAGTVAFEENGTVVGTQAVSSGVATLTTTKLLASAPGGASLTATFTPTNPSSFTSSTSAALSYTVNPVAAKPTLTGPHQVGQKETCNESLEPGVTATYAWKVGSTQVGTGKTLTVPASAVNKQLACTATVQDGSGPKSSATSSSVKVSLGKALTAVKKPSLSGSHKVGKTETVKPGTWSQKATFTYQWLLNGKVIKHATKSTFKPTKSDKGKKLSCRVTAHKAGFANGSATTSSVKVSS